jgi:hypothetical protein
MSQTQKITVKVPEIGVTDLGLVLIILSFSPTTVRLLRSLRVNHQGFQADFKGTKREGSYIKLEKKETGQSSQV